MEKMVNNRLIYFLESKKKIKCYQFGFRKGRSTTDPALCLEHEIRRDLGYLLVFQQREPGLQFRHPRLQSYKNTTFISCTIITKGGRGVTEHLTQRAGERRVGERNSTTVAMVELKLTLS
ncbi:hypothetical protein ILYODFUR_014904 [Ilyodon furcidens]|uniref:Reverse transcriptase domain-containing protein n=1 Tax=Ilyodon furcidens TaxID=33524 RepID=A0ABV0UTE4_9TELE